MIHSTTRRMPSIWLRRVFPLKLPLAVASLALALPWAVPAFSQQSSPPTEAVRPALSQVGETIAGLGVSRWKAPGDVRSSTQRDIDSIQRDLGSTLPPLLDQAASAPSSVSSAFAVYRNIDALYDVLLRVSETATLAGPQDDSASLESSLSSLESARRELGNSILQLATTHDRELERLRVTVAQTAAAAAAPSAPPKKTVIDDGPAPSTKSSTHKKKKPAPTAPSAAPATQPQ